jgi:hypothetical protein
MLKIECLPNYSKIFSFFFPSQNCFCLKKYYLKKINISQNTIISVLKSLEVRSKLQVVGCVS